jgi:RNA polymerase sigma factor (sigma-70 family)
MTTPAIMTKPTASPELSIDPHSGYGKLLSHPRLAEFLKLSLKEYTLQEADRDDLAAQVMDALWRRSEDADPPDNLPRLIALAKKVLEGKMIDFFRHREVERENLVEPPMPGRADGREGAPAGRDQPNFVEELRPQRSIDPHDSLEAGEKLAFVQEMFDDGVLTHDDVEVMEAERAGEKTLAELAKERGVEAPALRKRVQRIRDKIKKEWNLRSTRLLLITILMVLLLVTLAVAMAGRSDPPTPPQQKDKTVERTPRPQGTIEELPNPGIGPKYPPR